MGLALAVTVELTKMNCGECGGTYAINERYREQKYQKSGFWHCPYCQCSWGYAKGENARLKEQLAAETKRKEAALARENEERMAKEKLELKVKRINKGVCPECKRTFQNLARHMCTQHGQEPPKFGRLKLP